VSASFGDLAAMAASTSSAIATVDGITSAHVWRLNGAGVLELVSVGDGVGGAQVTARLAADYVQITGVTQIDTAVMVDLATETAFVDNLTVTRAQVADVIASDNYAQDASGLPTQGLQLDFATGQIKAAGPVIARNLVIASGSFQYGGGLGAGGAVDLMFVNTGIRIGDNDVWQASGRTFLAVAQVTPASASGAGSASIWGASCEVFNGFKWFGAQDWSGQGFANAWMDDPATLISPSWASGTGQRILMNIRLFTNAIGLGGPVTINWKVYEVT